MGPAAPAQAAGDSQGWHLAGGVTGSDLGTTPRGQVPPEATAAAEAPEPALPYVPPPPLIQEGEATPSVPTQVLNLAISGGIALSACFLVILMAYAAGGGGWQRFPVEWRSFVVQPLLTPLPIGEFDSVL